MGRRSKAMTSELPKWLNGLLVFGTMAAVVLMEMKRPLRKSRQSKIERDSRNVVVSWMAAATVGLAEKPVTAPLALAVHRNRLGLVKALRLPMVLDIMLSVALLDYTLYIWHYLTHKVPFLWRFHKPHHVDLDLDASTALRFHIGELLLSVPWRAAQVRLLGISPLSLAIWQTMTLMEIMFHHSNIRLPLDVERRLSRVIVTPRMHGIHHSIVKSETDSNWSTIFSWPDRLHGTMRLNVPQQEITIGVQAYQDPRELTLGRIITMPLEPERPWTLIERKEPLPLPQTILAG